MNIDQVCVQIIDRQSGRDTKEISTSYVNRFLSMIRRMWLLISYAVYIVHMTTILFL